LLILTAGSEPELESAFVTAVQQGADGLIITADPFFTSKSKQLVALARRYALPTTYPWRAYTIAGGLMSYGPSLNWAYEEIGDYTGRILKGAKPSELPIQAPTTFDFVINLNTARALGLSIPRLVLDRANEVIQ
jgi:putative ABC transport system substrate-binding protein